MNSSPVAIITGAGDKAFCAGGDLEAGFDLVPTTPDEIAAHDRQRTLVIDRVGQRSDDIVVVDCRTLNIFAESLAGDCKRIKMQMLFDTVHQGW